MSDELKTCPFCGGEASSFEDSGHSTAWEIGCFNGQCSAEPHVWEKTKAEAVAAWNTRADRIEELEVKLARAVEALEHLVYLQSGNPCTGIQAGKWLDQARTTLAELKGEDRG